MVIASKLDEGGKPAWLAAMIIGFVIFWPAGLALLAYMIATGRIGRMHNCRHDEMHTGWRERRNEFREEWRARKQEWRERKRAFREEMRARWHSERGGPHLRPTGNSAFDNYRDETLRRLEQEQAEFTEFLENLRKARDKSEFDEFMQHRRTPDADAPAPSGDGQNDNA